MLPTLQLSILLRMEKYLLMDKKMTKNKTLLRRRVHREDIIEEMIEKPRVSSVKGSLSVQLGAGCQCKIVKI